MVSPILGAVPIQPGQAAAVPGVAPADRVAAFDQAMGRQQAAADAQVTAQTAAQATGPVQAVSGAQPLSPADRARAGLDLAPVKPAAESTPGNMILDGLSNLRGIFDAREARLGEVMNRGSIDANSLMQMQVEVVNFTLLVDISSKLTGKTTQVFDTLMKGQ